MPSILFMARTDSFDQSAYTQRLQMLAKGLKERGIQTDFLYLGDRKITSHTMLPVYFPFINRLMRKYDLVHAGGPSCSFIANLCKLFTKTKVISDIHGDRIGEIRQEIENNKSSKQIGNFPLLKTFAHEFGTTYCSDYFITSSAPMKKLLMSRGVSDSRIFVIRSGVDISLFSAKSRTIHRSIVITYAGQFQTYQAVDDLVEAVKQVNDRRIRLKIIGFTEDDHEKKSLIRRKLNNHVQLIDRLPQDKLVKQLQKSDILVIPRRRSRVTAVALPTKFAEYIALEKPVLVANVDETVDFIHRYKCGFVYEPGISGLMDALKRILYIPEIQLKQIGERGRKLAETFFDWNIVGQRYYNILKNEILKISSGDQYEVC